MARTKFAYARYLLINRELRKKNWVKTNDLKDKIEEELGFNISIRQLEKDLEDMKSDPFLNYNAPIEYDKKNKAYCYTDKSFTIEKFNLKEDEILALKFHAVSLNQYRNFGLFKDFSNALQKIVEAVSIKSQITHDIDSRLIVQTDNNDDNKGVEYLSSIAHAIDKRKKINLFYKKFEDKKHTGRILLPYLLKEYKNRWYIIGKLDGSTHISTFALDRINKLAVVEDLFEIDETFDHKKYFKYSFGITTPNEPYEKIILRFTSKQGNYIKTLRIHHSQKIISENSRSVRISIEVIPCYELYEYLLGQGNAVKVISPKWVADKVADLHKVSANLYLSK